MYSSPSKLYAALIVLIGLIGGYVVYSSWIKPTETIVPPAQVSNQGDLASFKSLKIDFSAIDSVASKGLVIFGDSPVSPGVTGKKDLFAP
jgi:hypothetical protein